MLTYAAARAPRFTPLTSKGQLHQFIILVPAHNEETLLPALLNNLSKLDYPNEYFSVHVIADNCTDGTTAVAQQGGTVVHERFHETQRGKGYALEWALSRIHDSATPYDAVVILDADSIISSNFLRVMDARLARGERVIQAYYAARDPESGWNVGLRYAALAVLHFLRPQGRMVLGGSAGLKGNGMVFARSVMEKQTWTAALTEDIELHMNLLFEGERVTFAPDAIVWAEMPTGLAGAQSQHMRWERGRLQMARRYVPQLLKAAQNAEQTGNKSRTFLFLDTAVELIIPPFSILLALSGVSLVSSAFFTIASRGFNKTQPAGSKHKTNRIGKLNMLLSIGLVLGQIIYVFSGLRLAQAPRSVYKALLYSPVYLIWKCWQYINVLTTNKESNWVRTQRNNG